MTDAILLSPDVRRRRRAGWLAAAVVLALYGGMALAIDVPRSSGGFTGDAATYYMMGQSLAFDGDLAYRRADLERVFREYPSGPSGVFLRRGGHDTPAADRLFYGKAYIYPALAAPFVRAFGTNGFLFFNALLLTAAFVGAYFFVSARSGIATGLVFGSAFVFASVVPAYDVWITPELFNFTLGLLAYFFWLYREVLPEVKPNGWLGGRRADVLAGLMLGIATFSKPTSVLLLAPMVLWLLWRRDWRRAVWITGVCGAIAAALFAINIAVMGDWNYQGGDRSTFYGPYPFQQATVGFEVGSERARNAPLANVLFDREVFWSNLGHNLVYFVVGRNSGLVPYFFPGVFALVALLLAPRQRAGWHWLVLGGVVLQALVFVITQPYTYFGSGGSIGNRYFMGAYGLCVFLLPPVRRAAWGLVPWAIGSLFVGGIVLMPFAAAAHPDEHSKTGLARLLPVELTNVNDLPIDTDRSRVLVWYGDNPGLGDPGFQIYYLDDNVYGREADKSFWTRGGSQAEVLLKTDRPMRQLQLTLSAGPAPASGTIRLAGRSYGYDLAAGASHTVTLALGQGFPYKMDREIPARVWVLAITCRGGFTPILVDPASSDTRYLGVRVKPIMIP